MDSFSCTPVMTEVAQTSGKNTRKMSSLCTYNVAWHIFLGVLQKHTHTHTKYTSRLKGFPFASSMYGAYVIYHDYSNEQG